MIIGMYAELLLNTSLCPSIKQYFQETSITVWLLTQVHIDVLPSSHILFTLSIDV